MTTRPLLILAALCLAAPLHAGIQITEVMLNPSDAGGMPDASYEFLELYNDGAAGVNVQNWTIATSSTPVTTITASSLVIPPLGYLVIGKVPVTDFNAAYNVALTAANYVDLGGVLALFENTGDYFRIDDAGAVIQAELSVRPPREGWPSDVEGTSFALRRTTSSATPTLYQSGSNWINQADPALDILSVLNDAGGYSSPGRGPVMYWSVNTWDGEGGVDNRWSNALNWASNTVPTAGTVVAIGDDVTQTSIHLDDARSVFALLLQGSQPCTISGAGNLTVTGGHVISHSFTSAEDAIHVPLVLGGAFPWMLVENATLVLHAGVTGTGGWTKTGNGTLYLAGDVNYGGRYAQSLGTLELADHTFTAANLSVHGTVNDSGLLGTLRTTGTLTNYSANWSSLPSLIMQPPVGSTALLPFVNGLNRLEISGAGTVRLTSPVSCLHLDVAAGTLDLNGIFNGVTLTNGIAQLRAGATLRGQGGGLAMLGGGRVLSEGITTVADPAIVGSPGAGQTLLFDGSAPLTGLGILSKQNAGTMILSVDVSAKQFFLGGGIADLNDRTLTVTGGPALTTTLAGNLTDSGTTGTLILTTNLSNSGVNLTSLPNLTMAPSNAADVLQVQSFNGVGTFTTAGTGTTRMMGTMNAAGLDCASGLLDCNGIGGAVTVTSGTARLRAGASLRGFGGGLTLLGSSQVISEGITMVAGAAISVSPAAGQTSIVTGTAPLAGLSIFIKANAGTVQLGVDVSTQQYGQHAGTMDLNDRTLSVIGVPGIFNITTNLTGTLTDSGTTGTLFSTTTLNNSGVTFTSQPSITMAPQNAADDLRVQTFNGIGTFTVAGIGTTRLVGVVNAVNFDCASGTLELNGVSPGVRVTDGTARLRAAATINGPGSMEVFGNGQVVSEGVTTGAMPGLIVTNNAGQTTTLTGSAPLTGLGFLSKTGAGTLQFHNDVSAQVLFFNSGTVDLNARTVSATGGPAFTSTIFGTLTDSGTAGTLLASTHLQNANATITSQPNITMAPLNAAHVLTINSFNGVGMFRTAGTGTTQLIGTINAAGLDCASGTLDLNGGAPRLRLTSGTARLRSGAALKGPGSLEVLGNSQVLSEGITTVAHPGLIVNSDAGQTTVITGSAPLTGLDHLAKSGPGTLQLDSVDVSARQVFLYSGTLDLHGRTLESTTASAVTLIYNTLADSATGGTLKLAGTLQNISASFVSEPSLCFAAPGLFDSSGWTGLPFTGLGRVTAAGGATCRADTALTCRDLDVIRALNLSAGMISATQNMWLRAGSVTFAGGTGSLGLLGNGQLRFEGGFLSSSPQLTVFNDTGETAGFHSTAGPFAGLGIIFKNGPGALQLHADVIAQCLGTDYFSTTDLNGHTFTLYGLYPGLFEGAKFASGSVLTGPGTLSLERGLRNDGMSTAGAPVLEITRGAGDNARLSGEPITGFPLIRKTGVGLLIQYTDVSTDRAESLGGEWSQGSSKLTVSNGLLASGGGFGSINATTAGTVIINSGDVETILPGFVNVPQLHFRSAGLTRLLGDGDPGGVIVRQSGPGTLDLHARTLHTSEFHLEQGNVHDSLTGGMILHPQFGPIPNTFYMTGGILDALVEGSPDWYKNNLFTTTTIRGFLENSGDNFAINEGTLLLELTAPEDFNVGYLSVSSGAALAGRARCHDGSVSVYSGGRLRPDAAPGALSFGALYLDPSAILEVPAIAGASPIVVPPGDYLSMPETGPDCVLIQVTGAPVIGQTYNLFTWAGATMDGPPALEVFQLFNSPTGHLQFDAAGTTLQYVRTATGGYDTWKASNFTPAEQADALISGPHADPDHDGLTNLFEYALGGLPKFADAEGRLDFSHTTMHGQPVLACRFTMNRDATDVIIEPESATDLTNWTPAFLDPYEEKTATTHEFIAWTPRDAGRKQFRVRFRR